MSHVNVLANLRSTAQDDSGRESGTICPVKLLDGLNNNHEGLIPSTTREGTQVGAPGAASIFIANFPGTEPILLNEIRNPFLITCFGKSL